MCITCCLHARKGVEFILFTLIEEALSAKHSTRETIMIHDMQMQCMLEFIALRRRHRPFELATPECARASRGSE